MSRRNKTHNFPFEKGQNPYKGARHQSAPFFVVKNWDSVLKNSTPTRPPTIAAVLKVSPTGSPGSLLGNECLRSVSLLVFPSFPAQIGLI